MAMKVKTPMAARAFLTATEGDAPDEDEAMRRGRR
jgi:hypothetical protein